MTRVQVALLVIIVVPLAAFAAGAREAVREGNELFAQGDYEGALEHYADAEVDLPDSPTVLLNAGAALYMQDKFEEAATKFQRAAQKGEADLAGLAHYNLGNCNFKLGKLQEALESYKEAIQLDPTDMDAKFNYELTQKMLKRQAQAQQSQGQDKQQTTRDEDEDASQNQVTPTPSPTQDEQSDGDSEGTPGQGADAPPTAVPSASPEAYTSPVEGELTEEQLRQLLDYLAGKGAAAPQSPRRLKSYPKPDRDW